MKIKKFISLGIKIIILLIGAYILYFQIYNPHNHIHFQNTSGDTKEQPHEHDGHSAHRPSDWGWMQRLYPYGRADKTAVTDAILQVQQMRKSIRKNSDDLIAEKLRTAQWEFAGPVNVGGRISDIEYNPLDPNIVYAGAATGGVFKSYDGGWTWEPIFDEQAILSVGDIAVDPLNPEIVYVGTGEANGGHNNHPGGGVFKTTDGGQTWQLFGLEKTVSIGRIVIDPQNTNRVFVAAVGSYFGPDADRGVYRSLDGGISWEKNLFVSDSTGAIDIIINPEQPDHLLAAFWERVRGPHTSHLYGYSSGIYRTTDGGETWNKLGAVNGLPENELYISRIGLANSASDPNTIYALYTAFSNAGYTFHSIYKSDDEGINWTEKDINSQLRWGFGTFSWYFGNIRVHPKKPAQVYVLDVSFNRSLDSGDTWPIQYGYDYRFPDFHVDHHALAFHPLHPDTLIDGNDGGINISHDGGESWTKVGLLPVTQFYEITIDQTNPYRYYGGTQDNGTIRTYSGATNDWDNILGGDGFFVIVDPTNPDIIYAESQWGNLSKSTDGGISMVYAMSGIPRQEIEPRNWSTPVVMDPQNPKVLYYGTNRVYRTENRASSWYPISPDLTKNLANSRLGTVTAIAAAPNDSNIIYAGTDDGNVWVTANLGDYWTDITGDLPLRWVTRIAVDPKNDSTAYVTFSGLKWKSPQPHVFRTTNMGQTWQNVSSNLPDAPVNAILVDPAYSNVLYLGTDIGCFFSSNYGQSWDVLGEGLPVVPAYSMDYHPESRTLAVGTHGRSIYTLSTAEIVSVEQNSLSVEVEQNDVVLKWSTVSESNNHGFQIERKTESSDFASIGFIRGNGTVNGLHKYEYRDPDLISDTYYYRIKQIDFDGTFSYSSTRKVIVDFPADFQILSNYPNPFNSSTFIRYEIQNPTNVRLNIYNIRGERIRNLYQGHRGKGSYQIVWDARDDQRNPVATGVYLIELQAGNKREIRRMLYLK